MAVASCNTCPDDESRFRVPWDEIGVELMKAHLHQAHGLNQDPRTGDWR